MKTLAHKSFGLITTTLGLACCLPAMPVWAANQFWDNKGTSTPAAGTWDTVTADWANSTTLTSSLVVFTNGNFANFTAGTANLASLVVTVNSVVTCAGLGTGTTDGIGANTVGTLTFSGTGSIGLTNGLQNINCDSTNLDIIFDVPLSGPGGFAQHGNGAISLVNSNTYAGGTLLTGGQVIYYYTNASFGIGPITNSGSPGSALVNNTSPSAAVTIPNSFYWASGNNNGINLAGGVPVGGQPGTTFSGAFTLNSGVTIINTSNNTNEQTLISGVVSGSGASLSVADDGVLQLGGADTFNGNISISGPASLSMVGSGSLDGGTYAGTITDGSKFVYASSTPQTISGVISGTGSVIVTNNASLTLSGANTYSGNTELYPGTLDVTNISDSGSSDIGDGSVTMAGGTLLYTGPGDTTARTFNGVSGTTSTIDVPASTTVTLTGLMIGTAKWTVTKTDSGTLILSGSQNNPYFGMNINGGLVILNDGGGSALGSTTVVNSGATLQLGSNGDGSEIYDASTAPLTVSAGALFDLNGQNNSLYSFSLGGTGISGSGALINSASGTTATLTSPITLTAATTIGGTNSLGSISLPGPISGFGMSLTYAGTGMLTLGGANTYSGGTFITTGTVDGSIASFIPGNVTVTETNLLELDNPLAMAPTATITLSASAGVYLNFYGTQTIGSLVIGSVPQPPGTYGASGSGATYTSPAFSGTGILNVIQTFWDANGTDAKSQSGTQGGGTGSWDDTSTNWWVGGNSDTNWTDGNVAFFAGTAGTVTLNATHTVLGLAFTTPGYSLVNTDGASVLNLNGFTPTISISPAGTPTTISCDLTGGGSTVGLNASGPGTLVLSGNNTYSGGTTIAGGTTVSVNTISDSGPSALGLPATLGTAGGAGSGLAFTGVSGQTAATVTFNGTTPSTLNVPAGETLEFDGQVKTGTASATPILTYNGGGTLIFGGAVDNSGLTMAVQQGELIIDKTSASTAHGLGGGASSVGTGTAGNSAEIQLSGSGNYDLYSSCVLAVNSPDGMLDLNGQSDSMSTLTVAGTGPTGSGALINSAAGTTAVLANSGSGVILASNTLIGGSGSIALSGKISGASALTYAGAATLTLSNANTYSGGTVINAGSTVLLANSAAAAGTGPISLSGTMNVGIVGNNVILANAISGSGTVNLFETTNDNLQLGGAMTNFTGLLNCPAGVGTSKAQILTTAVGISPAATINLAAGGTLYVANSGVNIACPLNIYGIGNTEPYGALRLENGAMISGPVTLFGNTTMGNSASGAAKLATISGVISNSGGVFGITFTNEPGTIVLSATNTYTGATTIDGGVLEIGGAGLLGGGNYAAPITNNATLAFASLALQTLSGSIAGTGALQLLGPGSLILSGTNTYTNSTFITNALLDITGAGSLGNGIYPGKITNSATIIFGTSTPQTLTGTISGNGSLIQSGSGELTLGATNTYTGGTTLTSAGTLALAATGSISNSSSLILPAGATFDVSAYTATYNSGPVMTVTASGFGIRVGNTAATIKGGASAIVTLPSVSLAFQPQTFTGDATHPALYLSQGALNLTGTNLLVNNAGATPLGVGTYSLIQVAGGNISLAYTNVTVTGTGLAAGTAASLVTSGGSLNLVVATTVEPVPVISTTTVSGNNLIFSGTNGTGSGTYYVLSTTNLALPLADWTTIATNTFNADGSFSATNAIGTGSDFFLISH